ncbi:hypothetical protein [Mycobacterium sp. 852002-51971_SCH5477799-a]|uniref:hypothetical protein n=1 Tax=Mycobacterium sp. 852002-51971_SCH5477799-a TaxID=1834106 RepID=UPI000AA3562B
MTNFEAAGGQFWLPDYPEVVIQGTFTATAGEQAEVALEGGLPIRLLPGGQPPVPAAKVGDIAGVMRSHAAGSAARFRPVTVAGQLASGEFVTLLTAPNFGGPGSVPRYVASATVIGAVPVTSDQTYSAVRFLLDNPLWLAHLTDGDSAPVEDDQSVLSVEASPDGNWLVYESSSPVSLRQIESRVVSGCLALALFSRPERSRCCTALGHNGICNLRRSKAGSWRCRYSRTTVEPDVVRKWRQSVPTQEVSNSKRTSPSN